MFVMLVLSSFALARLEAATRILLSPLEFPSLDEWRSSVNRAILELLGTEAAVFSMPRPAPPASFSDELSQGQIARYDALRMTGADGGSERALRELAALRLGVRAMNQTCVIAGDWEGYHADPMVNEFYKPNHFLDVVGFLGVLPDDGVVVLETYHSRYGTPACDDRAMALLGLLEPAFHAGIRSVAQLERDRAVLAQTLDTLRDGLVACDASGRVLHRNSALARAVAADPEGARIEAEIERMARGLAEVCAGRRLASDPRAPIVRELRTARGGYRVRGTLVDQEGLTGVRILVTLERTFPEPPAPELLRARFGLTPAELRVALLIAQGKGNGEVARTLCLSPHTARHHTESIMRKLAVQSRAEAASTILRG